MMLARWAGSSPNSITLTFTETFLREKSWTEIMKVADTNGDKSWNHEVSVKVADTNYESRGHKPSRHVEMFAQSPWQVHDKPICIALMEFGLLQCREKLATKLATKSVDLVANTNHESPRHKSRKSATWFVSQTFLICVRDMSATLSGTCPGLCRKVGVMEFGLHQAKSTSTCSALIKLVQMNKLQ